MPSEYPEKPGEHFEWDEFECPDAHGTEYPREWRATRGVQLGRELDRVRDRIGAFSPTSVYRTWEYHCAIYKRMHPPGKPPAGSQHLTGRAADVPCPSGMTFSTFINHIKAAAAESGSLIRYIRFYRRQNFAHIDIRERKTLLVEYGV